MKESSLLLRVLLTAAVGCLSPFPAASQIREIPDLPDPGHDYSAQVHRDENGIPHILGVREEDAWYGLGYEEARDALYWVMFNLMMHSGQSARIFGSANETNRMFARDKWVENDAITRLVAADLEQQFNGNLNILREFLRRAPGTVGDPDQVYKNLKAYAAGISDYQKRLREDNLTCQEQKHRAWIVENGKWALTEPVTVWMVASYGPWVMRKGALGAAQTADVYSQVCAEFPEASTDCVSTARPVDDPFHEPLPGVELEGSVGFCWSHRYTDATNGSYSAVMSDSHAGNSVVAGLGEGFAGYSFHRWFAHIKVLPNPESPGDPGIDCFGWMHHGTGMLATFHNQNIAYGGSQAVPNRGDGFMLRLAENSNEPTDDYYDYYSNAWRNLERQELDIPIKDGETTKVHYYRAGRLGIVLPRIEKDPKTKKPYQTESPGIFYAKYPFPPGEPQPYVAEWNLGIDLETGRDAAGVFNCLSCSNPDSPEGPDVYFPAVVALRAPGDPEIYADGAAPFPGLGRLAVGLYEMMRAETVYDIQAQLVTQDASRGPNFCAIDREGRIFATVAAVIPRRGDDEELEQRGYSSLDKFDAYDVFDGEPVPARFASDRAFDWRFDASGALEFLAPIGEPTISSGGGVASNPYYLGYILFDPVDPSRSHPPSIFASDRSYENPGFIMASNDFIQYYYTKYIDLGPKDASIGGVGFNKHWDENNDVINNVLEAGTLYSSGRQRLRGGAAHRTRYVVDKFRAIDDGSDPPLDPDRGKDLAWDNREYVEEDYEGFPQAGDGALTLLQPWLNEYPPRVRGLLELNLEKENILEEARSEAEFFEDLWTALWDGNGGWQELKAAWVDNSIPLFWYPPDPSDPDSPGAKEVIEMPEDYALVDFLWSETRLGSSKLPALFENGVAEAWLTQFAQNVQVLKSWKGEEFRNSSSSLPAALLEQFELGFRAATNGTSDLCTGLFESNVFAEGRMWSPVSKGRVFATCPRFPSDSGWEAKTIDLADGNLPHSLDEVNRYTSGTYEDQFLLQLFHSYEAFDDDHLAGSPLADHEDASPILFSILAFPIPPYDALYGPLGNVRLYPRPQDVNAIVEFFLKDLGKFGLSSDGTTSTTGKVEAIDAWRAAVVENKGSYKKVALPWPDTYPLTRNLARITLMRRLIEAREFMDAQDTPITSLGDLYRTRVLDLNFDETDAERLRFPDTGSSDDLHGHPTEGSYLRAAGMNPAPGSEVADGFQARMYATGGSQHPLFTMLPADPLLPAESFFCLFPGNRPGTFDSVHYAGTAEAWAERELLPTHYANFGPLSSDESFPGGGFYQVPQAEGAPCPSPP